MRRSDEEVGGKKARDTMAEGSAPRAISSEVM